MKKIMAILVLASSFTTHAHNRNLECIFQSIDFARSEEKREVYAFTGEDFEGNFGRYKISIGLGNMEGKEMFSVEVKLDKHPGALTAIPLEKLETLPEGQTLFGVNAFAHGSNEEGFFLISYECKKGTL